VSDDGDWYADDTESQHQTYAAIAGLTPALIEDRLGELMRAGVNDLARAMDEAKEREAEHWIERVSPHDIFQSFDAPTMTWRLHTGAGLVLSEVRV
jgi:site-specific recombinase